MDPFSLALIGIGTGYSIYQQEQGLEQQEEYAKKRAVIAKQEAKFALGQHSKDTARTLSMQKVAYASGGVTQEGTPETIRRVTQDQAQLEAMAIIWGGEVGADTAFFEGQIAHSATRANQVSTLLTGASAAANIYRTPS